MKVEDTDISLETRKAMHGEVMAAVINPLPPEDFGPDFDINSGIDGFDAKSRPRVVPPKRLPTSGLHPKKIVEGQMIGMFESSQDLYLLIAGLSERVSDLEDQLNP